MSERELPDSRELADDIDAQLRRQGSFSNVFADVEKNAGISGLEIDEDFPADYARLLLGVQFLTVYFQNCIFGDGNAEAKKLSLFFSEWRASIIHGEEASNSYVRNITGGMNLSTLLTSAARRLALYKSKLDWGVTDEFEQHEYQRLLQIRNITRIAADL